MGHMHERLHFFVPMIKYSCLIIFISVKLKSHGEQQVNTTKI